MCYSAITAQDAARLAQEFEAAVSIEAYEDLARFRLGGGKAKVPKAMDDWMIRSGGKVAKLVQEWRDQEATTLQQELFTQRKRVADAERSLKTKVTKKAQDDVRIGSDKVSKAMLRLEDLRRKEPKERDSRIFPGVYCSVVIGNRGKRQVVPMRYQCRLAGKPLFYDTKFPGTYNARRDNLDGFWKGVFGKTQGLMVASRFYENVEGPDGKNQVLEFVPKTGEPMLIACLWSHWTDPKGVEPDLLSFAAITDDPEPEVAAAGHDRTIINIKPEHVDAWLNPQGDTAAMQTIFDDKRHPYYEHREAA